MDTSLLVRDIAAELQDPEFKRWSKEDHARHLTAARRALVLVEPTITRVTKTVALQEGSIHHIPEDGLRFIEALSNVDEWGNAGRAITPVDFHMLQRWDPEWRSGSPTGNTSVEHVVWDERYPDQFYTVPGVEDGVVIELVYALKPGELIAPAGDDWPDLAIPEDYAEPLRLYALHLAHSKETSAAAPQRASEYLNGFLALTGGSKQVVQNLRWPGEEQ